MTLSNIHLNQYNKEILSNINMSFHTHTIHSIVGAHGSGKSCLAQIISGIRNPTRGSISFQSRIFAHMSPIQARKLGIEYIQHPFKTFDNLRVYETFFLIKFNSKLFKQESLIKTQISRVDTFLSEYGLKVNPTSFMSELNPSVKLQINILKSIFLNPKIVILDEIFEILPLTLQKKIRALLHRVRDNGTSIILLAHKIDEIYGFADKISILRNGKILLTEEAANIDKMSLIHLTYTQMSETDTALFHNEEFSNLMKYNEAISNSLPFSLIIIDENLKIKFLNESAQKFLGITNNNYYNNSFSSSLEKPNKRLSSIVAKNLHKNEERKLFNIPVYLQKEKKQINLTIHPMRDGWNTIGFFLIIEDVTEQEQMRNRIALSDKLSSIGLLAAGVAHEINNPLAIMLNYIQSIKLKPYQKGLISKMSLLEEQINYISSIVSNLTTLSDGRVSNEEINLDELLLDIISFIDFYSKKNNVQISYKKTKPNIKIYANKNEIKQVLLNLFKNSFEAMPEGGNIFIETAVVDKKNTLYVQIIFKDTGIGLNSANIKDIYSPFYSTKKTDGGHLGLGLSISYAIINKYNGDMIINNSVKKGCQFEIFLPCIYESQA